MLPSAVMRGEASRPREVPIHAQFCLHRRLAGWTQSVSCRSRQAAFNRPQQATWSVNTRSVLPEHSCFSQAAGETA
ncbi:hypothetical protein E2C01_056610 [Portunus trituberculatus]|uniref:Uncharacterized protein n=1 Tax=Portunus trituberculatus TaxID=210409 RepID=A0A5B7GYP8_PORTR|nr:hypothetical protein [Portunus trituberculatus]